MKKKLIILAGVILIIVFLGRMLISSADADYPVSPRWEIEEQAIEGLEFIGCPKNLNVIIQQTEDETTKVQVEGRISKKFAEKVKEVAYADGRLSVALGSTSMVGVTIIPDEADELAIIIQLGKDTTVDSYLFDSTAAVVMQVPKEYEGAYDLNTNNEGVIQNVPKTRESEKTTIKVDAVGNINITK